MLSRIDQDYWTLWQLTKQRCICLVQMTHRDGKTAMHDEPPYEPYLGPFIRRSIRRCSKSPGHFCTLQVEQGTSPASTLKPAKLIATLAQWRRHAAEIWPHALRAGRAAAGGFSDPCGPSRNVCWLRTCSTEVEVYIYVQ